MSRYRQTTNRSGRGIGWMPRQLYKADFKILFTFYKLSGIMEREPHEEAGQWNSDMIRKPGFP